MTGPDKFTQAERRWQEWQPHSFAFGDRFIPGIVTGAAHTFGERPAFIFPDQSLSFSALHEGMERAAAGLQGLGIQTGDRVALMLPNSGAFLESWFGLNLIGAVSVPIGIAQIGEGLRHQIATARCRAIVIEADFLAALLPILPQLPELRHIIVQNSPSPLPLPQGPEMLSYTELTGTGRRVQPVTPDPTALASISYTSGTTGLPKGVIISHHYWHEIWASTVSYARLVDLDRHYCALPFSHMAAHAITGPTLLTGASAVVVPRFSASNFMSDIRRHGCSTAKYVGSIIPFLMKQPESPADRDTPLRLMIGSAAPPAQFAAFEARFNTRLLELYGMSECNACLVNPLDARRPGSCGKPSEGWSVAIMDDNDQPVAPGELGEIVAQPQRPWLGTSGYDGNAAASLELTRNFWIHTGDLGRQDAEGYFYFVDRKKQAIRRRGENISSFEVEAAANSHPAVLETAAVGVPSEHGEEEVKLVVRLRDGAVLAARDLHFWCAERLPAHAVPRYIVFRADLPKTPSHRIEKLRLKAEGISPDCIDLAPEPVPVPVPVPIQP